MTDIKPLHSFLQTASEFPIVADDPYEIRICNDFISRAFKIRGEVYQHRGDYHKALASYAAAYELGDDDGDMLETRHSLHRAIDIFFDSRLLEQEPRTGDAFARELAEKMAVSDGYHVVGGGNILVSYPFTDEGLEAAVDDANHLADDDELRREMFFQYLVDDLGFLPVVFRCEGRRVTKVHRSCTAATPI
jgi:hypothetical protein